MRSAGAPLHHPRGDPDDRPVRRLTGAHAAPPNATCIKGYTSPAPGSDEHELGIEIVRGFFGLTGELDIGEIRYFTGPDSPGVIEPRHDVVQRSVRHQLRLRHR